MMELEEGCRDGIYEEVPKMHSEKVMLNCAIIYKIFTVWKKKEDRIKGNLVKNASRMTIMWPYGTVCM